MRALSILLAGGIALLALAGGASDGALAQDPAVKTDINMVVALDRSESIDLQDRARQIDGLVHVLRHRRFIDAVRSGWHGRIALSVITWSSFDRTQVVLPWVVLERPSDFGLAIDHLIRQQAMFSDAQHGPQTDIALGIGTAVEMLRAAPTLGVKQVINMVADGVDNSGRVAIVDRDEAIEQGITINGLVQARGKAVDVVKRFFQRQVIGGPSAFVEAAREPDDFAEAMLRKMTLEIALLNAQGAEDDDA